MKVIIDSDTIAYACAASAEDAESWVAKARADEMVEAIITATDASEYELWLSGPDNFRYSIYPEYKANRANVQRPKWEKEVKSHLTEKWKANWSVGCEADDMCGVQQTKDTIIAHIDKDINMIPGLHYDWGLTRKGKVVRPPCIYEVPEIQALRAFYWQLLVGDPTDNVKGVKGIGPKNAERILDWDVDSDTWFERIRERYGNDDELLLNGQVLWIWRKLNDIWRLPIDPTVSES